jgi:hypothetical protein
VRWRFAVRDGVVLLASPDVLAMIPDAWYETIQLDVMQRAVVTRDGLARAEPLCSRPAAPLAEPRR